MFTAEGLDDHDGHDTDERQILAERGEVASGDDADVVAEGGDDHHLQFVNRILGDEQ